MENHAAGKAAAQETARGSRVDAVNVIVVGGGWSGLAAAVKLTRHGIPTTLIEAAGRLGGRASRVHYRGHDYDSGQHLLIGAYHGILDLLAVMGIDERSVFERHRFELVTTSAHPAPPLHLRLHPLPAPLHLVSGLAGARGISLADKWSAVKFCLSVARAMDPDADCSVQELLSRHRQSPALIARLWEPVCLAALNTPAHEASAEVFLRVLRDAFAHGRRDSDLLLPRRDLAAVLPEPARRFIEGQGGRIVLNRRVTALEINGSRVTGIRLANGERMQAEQIILALPPAACLRLIDGMEPLRTVADRLRHIESSPICTVYLRYPPTVRLEYPMIGLHGALAQWIFDHGVSGEPGLMGAVISGAGDHLALERAALQDRVVTEIAACFPHWPAPEEIFSLCEKRATFLCRAGLNALRPPAETPVAGCWLAGDAVATGYPATLEGAVRSGLDCARKIMQESR